MTGRKRVYIQHKMTGMLHPDFPPDIAAENNWKAKNVTGETQRMNRRFSGDKKGRKKAG